MEPGLDPIQSHLNAIHILTSHFFKDHFNIMLHSAGLRAGWSGLRLPAWAGNFSFHHRVQTGNGAHPASYAKDSRGFFPVGKAAGLWSWPLAPV